jgi:hypothetical protein
VPTPSGSDGNASLPAEQDRGLSTESPGVLVPRTATEGTAESVKSEIQPVDQSSPDARPSPEGSITPLENMPLPAPPMEEAAPARRSVSDVFGGRNLERGKHSPIEPRARHMSGIDFSAYVVSSRYVTLNLIMILLASAVLVAAFLLGILAVDTHANPGFTVGLTSAGTVAVTALAGAKTIKKRRQTRQKLQSDDAPTREGREAKNPPK